MPENLIERSLTLPLSDARSQDHIGERKQDAAYGMHTKAALPHPYFKTKVLCQSDNWNRQQCEDVPIAQGEIDSLFPAHSRAGFGARDVKMAGKRESQ